jgi:outer membrane biosynthesis protein TonB
MKLIGKAFSLILIGITVSGCRHQTKATPPQAAQAAPIAPATTYAKNGTSQPPPPSLPPPELPKIGPPAKPTSTEPAKPHKSTHHKPKPSEQQASSGAPAASAPASAKEQNTEVAASNPPTSDASPIGPLSAAGESITSPRRNQILDEINSTEKGLNDIKRPLSSDEQTTATQIRAFITKAKEALNQEDLDAAHSLMTRAKVLLDELTKQ